MIQILSGIFQKIDTALFYYINVTLQNPFFDWLMPFITEKYHWLPVWGAIIVLLIWKGGRQGRYMVIMIIPVIILSDQISSSIIKPLVERTRPCVALAGVHLLTGMKTSYSFPSSHAANFFATAAFFSYFHPKWKWMFYSAAALVGISRISVGVHYPFDVVGGALLGIACAWSVIITWKLIADKYQIQWRNIETGAGD
jgi:undecaprenyl-diphosphatase